MLKTKSEIDSLRKAARMTVEIFNSIRIFVKKGNTERFVKEKIEDAIRQKGLKISFKTIVASGPNAADPHAVVSDRPIGNNEAVMMDFGLVYKGFHSDLTRMVVIGKLEPKLNAMLDAVKHAHSLGIKNIRPGLKIREYVKTAHDSMRDKGFVGNIRHTLGHGVGTRIHEAPKLSERNKKKLAENMVVTVEPGLYEAGLGGVRIEDMVLITKNGCEVLTR